MEKLARFIMSAEVLLVTFTPLFLGLISQNVVQKQENLIKNGISRERLWALNPIGNQSNYRTLDTLQDSLSNRRWDSTMLVKKGTVPTKKILDSMQTAYKSTKLSI